MKSFQQFVVCIVVVILTFWPAIAVGTNFTACLADVNSGLYGTGVDVGGTDNFGRPVNVPVVTATAVTYDLCLRACGPGQEPFNWTVFSQQFSAWLLPWLALVSQLPFGANNNLDNLDSVLLTVGSPTLAAYSLALTVLNGYWVAQRFKAHTYPNVEKAIRILSSLQQSPLKIETKDGLLASLVVLPENDGWWSELVEWINYTHTWSIAAATSIAWVVIAYLFTLIDAATTGGLINSINATGQGIGSLWLWLLPIVIGWLQISPKCDSNRLSSAVDRANKMAYVVTDEGVVPLKQAKTEARAIELTMTRKDYLRRDEKCTVPIYNYARLLPWVQAVEEVSAAFEAASNHYHNHESVNFSKWVAVDQGEKPDKTNRVGTAMQVEQYCKLQRNRSRWGPKVVSRIFVASAFALMLQWGTAGAAIAAAWFTPTQGLGCRSGSYLVYAALSTVVWMLLLASSILTHYYTITTYGLRAHAAKHFSIFFRLLGKFIAAFNAIWIVLVNMLQFGGFFDRCYCNSNVLSLRDRAYNVIAMMPGDVSVIKSAWVGGVCMAAGSVIVYTLFVNVFINPLGDDD